MQGLLRMAKEKDLVDFCSKMETYTKENGSKTKSMERVCTPTSQLESCMKVNGALG